MFIAMSRLMSFRCTTPPQSERGSEVETSSLHCWTRQERQSEQSWAGGEGAILISEMTQQYYADTLAPGQRSFSRASCAVVCNEGNLSDPRKLPAGACLAAIPVGLLGTILLHCTPLEQHLIQIVSGSILDSC